MIDDFLGSMLTLERWPFWSAAFVFMFIGLFTSRSLFTRERAYRKWPSRWQHHFWYWMRESQILHPVVAGFVLGNMWRDPEGQGWPLIGSQMYFAVAGGVGLFLWAFVRGFAKHRGIELTLPGQSVPPEQSLDETTPLRRKRPKTPSN